MEPSHPILNLLLTLIGYVLSPLLMVKVPPVPAAEIKKS
jgi:hypothetical protein